MTGARSEGERSVAIGGNVSAPINTGDTFFQILLDAPRPLAEHLRAAQFQTIIRERTHGFIGREFVFKEIERHLTDLNFPSGYILIKGEPGVGKTSLLAELVRRHGFVHHFNDRRRGIRSNRTFLGSVCAQLIVRYRLNYKVLPDESLEDGGLLSELLEAAQPKGSELPLVILVDALDEAEDIPNDCGANSLFLPSNLPKGVFVILTTRERVDYKLLVDQLRVIAITDNGPENIHDLQQYCKTFLSQNSTLMAERLTVWGTDYDTFCSGVVDKSEGNFMYLVLVLQAIRDDSEFAATAQVFDALPAGLRAYYQYHWRVMKSRGSADLQAYYEPVLCLLASAVEPVSIPQLLVWTKRRWPELNGNSVLEVVSRWREFLNEDKMPDHTSLYRIYHGSFQDFLNDEVGLKEFNREIAESILCRIPYVI